jgi:18S rRNA (guanine1575-N7)-methyltransferase
MDISPAMLGMVVNKKGKVLFGWRTFFVLEVALEREVEGDLMLQDAGQGVCYRPGTFDGAIR